MQELNGRFADEYRINGRALEKATFQTFKAGSTVNCGEMEEGVFMLKQM